MNLALAQLLIKLIYLTLNDNCAIIFLNNPLKINN